MKAEENNGILGKGDLAGEIYEIIRLLGMSAANNTYLVRSCVTGKRYVLKHFLHAFTGRSEYEEFFERLKANHADFIHPNIVGVHKVTCYEEDYFIIYSYVAAGGGKPKTLCDRVCSQGRVHEFQAKNILLQICGGLHHAVHNNRRQVHHHDLKPSNILFDQSHLIRISDFTKIDFVPRDFFRILLSGTGYTRKTLGKLGVPEDVLPEHDREAEDTESTSVINMGDYNVLSQSDGRTRRRLFAELRDKSEKFIPDSFEDIPDPRVRSIVESYSFMSPEQRAGHEPDQRSNIYSLGMIVYYMLSGKAMRREEGIPEGESYGVWNDIIRKCVAADPAARFQTIEELQHEIIRGRRRSLHLVPTLIYAGLLMIFGLALYLAINRFYSPTDLASQTEALNRAIADSGMDVSARLSVLEVMIRPAGASLEIIQNGTRVRRVGSVPESGFKYIIPPGDYELEIHKPGYQLLRQSLKLTPGIFRMELKLSEHEIMATRQYVYRQDLERPQEGFPFIVPGLGIEMLPMEKGSFMMGAPAGAPARGIYEKTETRENIDYNFWIGKYEVTQTVYESLMLHNPSVYSSSSGQRPVERVSWKQAMEFCSKLTSREKAFGRLPEGYEYRLPDEREWEYCCRAGTITDYNFGNNEKMLTDFAVFSANSLSETADVGGRMPNRWGIYDMHGNVAEWVYNHYPEKDDDGNLRESYVRRGGSWRDTPAYLRNSSRQIVEAGDPDPGTGFRIVLAPVRK